MASDITKVTLDSAAEKLRAQIRDAFADLLTPEQWKELVRKELDSLFEPRLVWKDNRQVDTPSLFAEIVSGIFAEEVRRHAVGVIKTGDWDPSSGSFWQWGHFHGLVSKNVEDWLTANASQLMAITLHQLMAGTAQGILAQVRDEYGPRCPHCGRPYPSPDDNYCSACGRYK